MMLRWPRDMRAPLALVVVVGTLGLQYLVTLRFHGKVAVPDQLWVVLAVVVQHFFQREATDDRQRAVADLVAELERRAGNGHEPPSTAADRGYL